MKLPLQSCIRALYQAKSLPNIFHWVGNYGWLIANPPFLDKYFEYVKFEIPIRFKDGDFTVNS